jgi:two-component system, NtrC family, nitrogen regulation sensor histidine kinase NtrY
MKLNTKYIFFIASIHLAAFIMSYFVFRENKIFFIVSELFILLSIFLSWGLYRQLIQPVQMLASGAEAIADRDFSIKLIPTGQEEVDVLVRVYNQMIEQLRSERLVQAEQHYFLEKLIQTSPIGILILDLDGQFYSLNPRAEALIGLGKKELEQQDLRQIRHPLVEAIVGMEQGTTQVLQTDSAKKFKVHKAGFIDRGFRRSFVTIEELTLEILEAEKKAYGKVIRMMAHEVNNTLGAVNSILDTAQSLEQNPRLQQAWQVAIERNSNLAQFMTRFADVIRLPLPNLERVDARELLQKAADLMRFKAAERSIHLEMDLGEKPIYFQADRTQMEQVLLNALKNAIEAMSKPGKILLQASDNPILLQIIDEGEGIPAGMEDLLFSPFFSTKDQGQGIGLTLIREILMMHGFDFSLKTGADGKTVFEVRIETQN